MPAEEASQRVEVGRRLLEMRRVRTAGKDGQLAARHLPLERLEREETFAQLRSVLEQMPEADREILTLRYALDYHANDIAELLAINTTAVHMRLSRARQRLAERLSAQGVVALP